MVSQAVIQKQFHPRYPTRGIPGPQKPVPTGFEPQYDPVSEARNVPWPGITTYTGFEFQSVGLFDPTDVSRAVGNPTPNIG